jgi:hypothetical protein
LAATSAGRDASVPHAAALPQTAAARITEPGPLRGVPLPGRTGLKLVVASDPPFLLDVDSGRVGPLAGLHVHGHPVLTVLAVGADALVWLDRLAPARGFPSAELYVVRHGSTVARRIGSGWEVAPAGDGRAVWVKSYAAARRCHLRKLGVDGRLLIAPRALPCSSRLATVPGVGALLGQGSSLVDPETRRTLLRSGGALAIAGRFALGSSGRLRPLTLTNLRDGRRRLLPWPSQISHFDDAAVQPHGDLVAVGFADPAFGGGGTQVTDVWLLDPVRGRFSHLPDMPAAVALKFTSMCWTGDGRLVWLAETGGRDVVAVWRPGQHRIAVRPARLPARNSGSDSFVVWSSHLP